MLAVLTALLAINTANLWLISRARVLPRPWLTLVTTALLVGLVAQTFTPFLVAPGLAAVIAMAIVLSARDPRVSDGRILAALMSGAIVIPWLLEVAGVLPATARVRPDEVILDVHWVTRGRDPNMWLLIVYATALVTSACWMARTIRKRERTAKRQLLVQAWQLRQLVPR
jgi:hypothetical protein